MRRYGQASIEYLMNYAWAIALIIIVAVALFSLDIAGLQSAVSGSSSGVGESFETVGVTDYRVHGCSTTTNCTLDIAFRNNGEERINVTNVTVLEMNGKSINGMVTSPSTCAKELFPGERLTCISMEFDAENVGTFEAGESYDIRVRVSYEVYEFGSDTALFTSQPERTLSGKIEAS